MLKRTILLLVLLFSYMSGQQDNSIQSDYSLTQPKRIYYDRKPGHTYNTILSNDGKAQIIDNDLTEEVNVIIEFNDEPLFLKGKTTGLQKIDATTYQNCFKKFSSDINNIQELLSKNLGINLKSPVIKNIFYKIFNGVSLSITKAALSGLYSLGYIKRVYADNEIRSDLNESTPLINGDPVWRQLGTEGDSVIVGLFDTGINYLNPSLGKGFGKGYKVIGGYDFVNNDNDPMDEQGHGTRAAELIAADSDRFKGIAPKAVLMAFKIFNSDGYTKSSTIISAIEKAADPFDEGNPGNRIDVASINIPAGNNSDDIVSTVINNASKLGIAFCTSSRNNENNSLKTISFASISSAYTAGVCALLKKLHPSWTPEKIKSALMSSANDIGKGTTVQSSGRIDVLSSAKNSTFALPCALNFGRDNLKAGFWNNSEEVLIVNEAKSSQNYNIDISGLQPGITLKAEPQSFSISSGDSIKVKFSLQVDNSIINNPAAALDTIKSTYSGQVNIIGTLDKIHFAWAFVKSSGTIFRCSQPIQIHIINSQNHYTSFFQTGETQKELYIASGKYDILSAYTGISSLFSYNTPGYIFNVKEDMFISSGDVIDINMADSKNLIKVKPVDDKGYYIPYIFGSRDNNYTFSFTLPSLRSSFNFYYPEALINSFSERFNFRVWGAYIKSDRNLCWFYVCNAINAINKSMEFTNDHTKYIEQNFSMSVPTNIPSALVTVNSDINITSDDPNSWVVFSTIIGNFLYSRDKCLGTIYFSPTTKETVSQRPGISLGISTGRDPQIMYPSFAETDGYISLHIYNKPTRDLYQSKIGEEFQINNELINLRSSHRNNINSTTSIVPTLKSLNQLEGYRRFDENNTLIRIRDVEGFIIQEKLMSQIQPMLAVPGTYKTEATNSNYMIRKKKGLLTSISSYDLARLDPNAPSIKSLQIRNSKGIPSESLEKNEKAIVTLAAYEVEYTSSKISGMAMSPVFNDSTRILIKESRSKTWNNLVVNKISEDSVIGSYYSADLSNYTNFDSASLDLRIVVYDKTGNSLEYTLEPAVAIGKFVGDEPLLKTEEKYISIPKEFKLNNCYPNPFNPSTKISYSLPEKAKVKIDIYNILAQRITTLIDKVEDIGDHDLIWDAKNQSSGIYLFRIKAEGSKTFEKYQKLILMK